MRRILTISVGLTLVLGTLSSAQERPKAKTVEGYFSGKVVSFKARRIALEYDLARKESLRDFTFEAPFSEPPSGGFEVADGKLRGRGVGAFVHVGVFEADLKVSLSLSSPTPRDMGVLLMEPGVTGRFLLFGLADTFLSERDRQPTHQHMITVHGVRSDGDTEAGTVFRYLRRSRKPALEADKAIEIEVLKRGERNRFTFAETYMDAEDRYERLPELQPALYVIHSEMTVTKLEIGGKLTVEWLTERGIAFDPKEKDDEELREIKPPEGNVVPVPDEEDPPGWGGPPWGGGSEASRLVAKVRDTALAEKERREAADGLTKENVKLDELRALIDCLYSGDLLTRTLAIEALKKVTGKTLGYQPKARERDRENAIRNWYKFLMQNRDKFR